jgi:hypothetical protein
MAGIDKIYGTKADALALERWLHRHRPKFRRYLYGADNFDHIEDNEERPISNFSRSADSWLARHCPLPFVLERLCNQYTERHKVHNIAAAALSTLGVK